MAKKRGRVTRRVFHVTYDYRLGRWITWDVSGTKSHRMRASRTKAAALRFAILAANSRRHIGQVVVHTMDGKIETEWTYGCDPVRSKG